MAPPKPPKKQTVQLRVEPALLERVDGAAAARQQTRTAFVVSALLNELDGPRRLRTSGLRAPRIRREDRDHQEVQPRLKGGG